MEGDMVGHPKHTSRLDHLLSLMLLLVMGVLLVILVTPGGRVYNLVAGFIEDRHRAKVLRERWPELSSGVGQLDGEVGEVRLVEFMDYQCPYCQQLEVRLRRLHADYPRAGLAVRHFPLPIHPLAEGAARAAICAEEQGRFAYFHDQLFTTDAWQRDTNWVREAVAAGVTDTSRFKSCIGSAATTQRLEEDRQFGEELGVNTTPTIVSVHGVQPGLPSEVTLAQLLQHR